MDQIRCGKKEVEEEEEEKRNRSLFLSPGKRVILFSPAFNLNNRIVDLLSPLFLSQSSSNTFLKDPSLSPISSCLRREDCHNCFLGVQNSFFQNTIMLLYTHAERHIVVFGPTTKGME